MQLMSTLYNRMDSIRTKAALTIIASLFFWSNSSAQLADGGSANFSLPVKLEYFNIMLTAPKKLDLNWKTAEQFTSVVYELQRAADNYEFSTITTIIPPDNSTTPRVYQYRDDFSSIVVNKVLFYRIKQTQNGKISFSDVKAFRIATGNNGPMVEAGPNPVGNTLQVNLYTEKKAKVTLVVNDISGKVLFTKTFVAEEGNNTYNLSEVASVAKGVFFMKVYLDANLLTIKKLLKI